MPADRTETSIPPAREAPQLPGPLQFYRSKNIPVLLPTDAFSPSEKDLGRCEQGEDQPAPQSHRVHSPRSLESVYTQNPSCLRFQTHLAPLNRDPLIKIRDRPFLAFPFSEKAVKFSKRSQSQSKVCQELSSLGGCSRSPAGGAGCVIQNSLDPGKENRNQAARARGAAEPRRNAGPGSAPAVGLQSSPGPSRAAAASPRGAGTSRRKFQACCFWQPRWALARTSATWKPATQQFSCHPEGLF